jgi:hypothetical protein
MSRRPEIIDPKLKVGDYVHLPLSRDPLQLAEETDPTMNATSGNWSGAVQTAPPTGQTFCFAFAKWIVPAAYPPQDMKNSSDTGWIDGTYVEGSWVGLDGWSNGSVFQTGSASQVTVKGGAIVSTSYFAWHEWFPAGYIEYSGLPITGGDFVSAFVWGTAGSNTGYVSFTNLTTNQSTGLLKLTAPPGTFIQGASAEWISEDPTGKFFPNYGAEVFIDCTSSAHTADGQTNSEQTLAGATLVNAVQPPPIGTISTAFEENSTTLYTYAYTDTSGA